MLLYVSPLYVALCVSSECHSMCLLYNSRVSDQNGVSLLYTMLEIHHFGREPSNYVTLCVPSACYSMCPQCVTLFVPCVCYSK